MFSIIFLLTSRFNIAFSSAITLSITPLEEENKFTNPDALKTRLDYTNKKGWGLTELYVPAHFLDLEYQAGQGMLDTDKLLGESKHQSEQDSVHPLFGIPKSGINH